MFDDRPTGSSGHPYRRAAAPLPPATDSAAASDEPRRMQVLALILMALCAWVGFTVWREHRLAEAVAAMPLAAQETTYRRTYEELSTACVTQPQLTEHCRTQAEFIVRFPQCSDDCRQLTRRFLSTGPR